VAVLWTLHGAEINGSTENSGPENGVPKKDKRMENAGLKMQD